MLSFVSLSASTPKKTADTLSCLHLKGRVIKSSGPATDLCKIQLYLRGKIVDSVFTADSKVFDFTLLRNEMYTIRITKKDHVSKLVIVNTEFPSEITDVLQFSFKTDLLSEKEAKDLNKDALDFPAAIIHFESKHELFVYNERYTRAIKDEIYSAAEKNKLLAKASK